MLKNALESQLINQLSDTLRSPPSLGDYSDLFLTKESQVFLSLIKNASSHSGCILCISTSIPDSREIATRIS